jgi:hypothetical protein
LLATRREGHDRTSIAFSDAQLALITAVTAAAKGQVVVQIHCLNQSADSFLELHKAVRLKI